MSAVVKLRSKMDRISLQLVELLLERRKLADQVIAEKRRLQQDIWDPRREEELLRLLTENLPESDKHYISEIFKTIFLCTRGRQ